MKELQTLYILAFWCFTKIESACDGDSKPSDIYFTSKSGGNVPEKTRCCFPFTYKGISYNQCINVDHQENLPWCATENSYEDNEKWGNCVPYPGELI